MCPAENSGSRHWQCLHGKTTDSSGDDVDNHDSGVTISCPAWKVEAHAIAALCYMVMIQSCFCYFLLTWGAERARTSNVLLYTSLNPTAAAVLTCLLVASGHDYGVLSFPSWNLLGAVPIIVGIGLVVVNESRSASEPATSS